MWVPSWWEDLQGQRRQEGAPDCGKGVSQAQVVSELETWKVDGVGCACRCPGADTGLGQPLRSICFASWSIQSASCGLRKPNYCPEKAFLTGLDCLLCQALNNCWKKRRGVIKIRSVSNCAALLCLGPCLCWVSAVSPAVSLSPIILCPAQK